MSSSNNNNNIVLFNQIWNNIVIKNHILFFLRLYNLNYNAKKFYNIESYLDYPHKEYLNNVIFIFNNSNRYCINNYSLIDNSDINNSCNNLYNNSCNNNSNNCIYLDNNEKRFIEVIQQSIFILSTLPSNISSLTLDYSINPSFSNYQDKHQQLLNQFIELRLPSSVTSLKVVNYPFIGFPKYLHYNGNLKFLKIESLNLANQIKKHHIIQQQHQNQPQLIELFPNSLEYLSFKNGQDLLVNLIKLPSQLKKLKFSDIFNQELENYLPKSITHLKLGFNYRYQLNQLNLPSNLKALSVGSCESINNSIKEKPLLPSTIEELTCNYNLFITNTIPESVLKINFKNSTSFTSRYKQQSQSNQILEPGLLPLKLRSITFNDDFNMKLIQGSIPPKVEYLRFGDSFNQSCNSILPSSITYLQFGTAFQQQILNGSLPNKLNKIVFNNINSHGFKDNSFPISTKSIYIKNRSSNNYFQNSSMPILIPQSIMNFNLLFPEYTPINMNSINSYTNNHGKSNNSIINQIPKNIESIFLTTKLFKEFKEVSSEFKQLKYIKFDDLFDGLYISNCNNSSGIGDNNWSFPDNVRIISFGKKFNNQIKNQLLPKDLYALKLNTFFTNDLLNLKYINLKVLQVGPFFKEKFSNNWLPESLEILIINNSSNPIQIESLPKSLHSLYIPSERKDIYQFYSNYYCIIKPICFKLNDSRIFKSIIKNYLNKSNQIK